MTDLEIRPRLGNRSTAKPVALWGIGLANPAFVRQEEAAMVAEEFSCEVGERGEGQRAWLRRVFLRSGVNRRGSVLANADALNSVREFYKPLAIAGARGPATGVRMQQYAVEAPKLMLAAARDALAGAAVSPADITHIITVTCTGFYAPGLDVDLINGLGLRADVRRTQVGFMGCHAAFNALARARDAVLAEPEAVVLVCCVELCTLHFAYGWNPEKLVANALFGDGAGACVIGAAGGGAAGVDGGRGRRWQLLHNASLLFPDSAKAMTWQIGDNGFEMTLSSQLPALIGERIRPWCERWLAEAQGELMLDGVNHWAIHPGGPRILSAAAAALGLPAAALHASEGVLAEHGNMSSATVLFVLRRLLATAQAGETCVALGFGPGLMAEGMLLTCE